MHFSIRWLLPNKEISMKYICLMAALLILLIGCAPTAPPSPGESTPPAESTASAVSTDICIPLDLPANFTLITPLGENFYGYLTHTAPGEGLTDEFCLIHRKTGEITPLTYPADLPPWTVGSGTYVILRDQYLYEWLSYTAGTGMHDMKLTRIDGQTGRVEVMDEAVQNNPFIYLCPLGEEEFLAYRICREPGETAEYTTVTTVWHCSASGECTEIIREHYENDVSWADSRGRLLERLTVSDGKILALGRRRIGGEYRFFLYRYTPDGTLTEERPLDGLAEVMGDEQPAVFARVGNCLLIRTYESLALYLCIMEGEAVRLLLADPDGGTLFAYSGTHIFTVGTGETDTLRITDASTGEAREVPLSLPCAEPYLVNMLLTPEGDLLLSCAVGGSYNPQNLAHFLLPREVLG